MTRSLLYDIYLKIKDRFSKSSEFFNVEEITKLLNEHYESKKDNSRKIWTIYSFLTWYDEYFVKKARKAATCKKDCCFSLQHKSAKETPRNRCHQISNLHISCRWVSCRIHLCFQLPPRREACNSVWEHPESRKLIVG